MRRLELHKGFLWLAVPVFVVCLAGLGSAWADAPEVTITGPNTGSGSGSGTYYEWQYQRPSTDEPGTTSKINCEAFANFPGAEPPEYLSECGGYIPGTGWVSGERFPTDTGYAQQISGVVANDNFVSFTLNNWPGQTVVGSIDNSFWGMTFDPSGTTLWAIEDGPVASAGPDLLGTIDPTTGVFTTVSTCGSPGGGILGGLTVDPTTGIWYASDATDLYTIDPTDPTDCTPVLVGPFGTPGALMIAIACDAFGNMYGHDIGDDAIYSIDKATGAATLIGSTGFAANFAQGMAFDWSDGTLYIWLYIGSGANVFGTVDLATGAVTPLAVDNPLGEFEGAIEVAAGDFEPLSCNGAPVGFEAGVIPDDWSITTNALPGGEWLVSMDNSSSFWTIPPTPYGSWYASANDDFPGSGSDGCCDYLYSNVFDLSDASQATLSFGYFFDGAYGQIGGVQVSPDGGTTWDPEVFVGADPAWMTWFVDMTPYAGLPAVQVRFHSDDAGAWASGFAVDNIALDCALPSITMDKTVGTDPAVCSPDDSIVVGPGTDVYYCYFMTNTGNITLTLHDVVDSELGILLGPGFPAAIPPASAAWFTVTTPIAATTVNTGTWTAYNPGGPAPVDVVSDSDTATVVVSAPAPLVCNGPTIGFDAGIPPDWTVANNAPGNPVEWTDIAGSGELGNYATGNGDAASASSDLQGGGSGLYDTELWTPPIDLTGVGTVTLEYWVIYANFAGVDFLDLDISTDAGVTWTNLLSWNEDHHPNGIRTAPGEFVSLDLTAYANQTAILRWHYYDPTGPVTSQDWYTQVDEIALSCAVGASIDLVKTVGLDPNVCAATDSIDVFAGTDVTYCYEVTNTGTVTMTTHDLVDSELGTILSGFAFDLTPMASVFLTQTTTINASVVNTATWTALDAAGAPASDSDTANVTVLPDRCPAGYHEVVVEMADFENPFPPAGWTVVNNSTGGTGVCEWTNTDPGGRTNLTGGAGAFAVADSDECGSGSIMDTEMWTRVMDLTILTDPQVTYWTDYNDISSTSDIADLDFSIDGGATWTNLISWNEDHRGPLQVVQPFAAGGESNVLLRWNYINATYDWWWEVDDVLVSACEPDSLPAPLVCNGNTVAFDFGPPADWTVIDNEGNGLVWSDLATCGEGGNYTNGSGDCACASSDIFGVFEYDTEMWSPPFDTTGQFVVQLSYSANYQDVSTGDLLDIDVSTDGGTSWTNVLSWAEDHGTFRGTPGEDVVIDISAVAGNQASVIIRWHYYNPGTGDWDWYAQIDDASLFCDIPVKLLSFTID